MSNKKVQDLKEKIARIDEELKGYQPKFNLNDIRNEVEKMKVERIRLTKLSSKLYNSNEKEDIANRVEELNRVIPLVEANLRLDNQKSNKEFLVSEDGAVKMMEKKKFPTRIIEKDVYKIKKVPIMKKDGTQVINLLGEKVFKERKVWVGVNKYSVPNINQSDMLEYYCHLNTQKNAIAEEKGSNNKVLKNIIDKVTIL